jgi:hypothetical protein
MLNIAKNVIKEVWETIVSHLPLVLSLIAVGFALGVGVIVWRILQQQLDARKRRIDRLQERIDRVRQRIEDDDE